MSSNNSSVDPVVLARKIKRNLAWRFRYIEDRLYKTFSGNPGFPTYWSYSDNFGEWISALFMRKLGVYAEHVPSSEARLASTGSILEHLPEDFNGIILGSGFIKEDSLRPFAQADVRAVRGPLTADRISSLNGSYPVLGDPGLLSDRLLNPTTVPKKYTLGIVPHYSDFHLRRDGVLQELLKREPDRVVVIDVQQAPSTVFRMIAECEHILSSSLHGLIVADSFGIPNQWLEFSTLTGGRFKFHDYYASLGLYRTPVTGLSGGESLSELTNMTRFEGGEKINETKRQLWDLFTNLCREIRETGENAR